MVERRWLILGMIGVAAITVVGIVLGRWPAGTTDVRQGSPATAAASATWDDGYTAQDRAALELMKLPDATDVAFRAEMEAELSAYPDGYGTLCGSVPIGTADMAIACALRRFPQGHNPRGAVARIAPYSVVDAWRGGSSPDTEPKAPAWVVGILGDDLSLLDVFPAEGGFYTPAAGMPTEEPLSDPPVAGVYFVWDANAGTEVGYGTIQPAGGQADYASLTAMKNYRITPQPATLVPAPTQGTPSTEGGG